MFIFLKFKLPDDQGAKVKEIIVNMNLLKKDSLKTYLMQMKRMQLNYVTLWIRELADFDEKEIWDEIKV